MIIEGPLRPLATGRTAEILALDDERVLKLYLDSVDRGLIEAEHANSEAASGCGATPVVCHGLVEHAGRPGLVFDALTGASLTEMAERNLLRLAESGRILARTHHALHQHSGQRFPEARQAMAALLDTPPMAFLSDAARARARAQILALAAGDRLLHMDFHTQNVFAHRGGYAVIDWQTTLCGAPAADVACTMFLLAEAELWPGIPLLKQLLYNAVRRLLRRAYYAEYKRLSGMTDDAVAAWRLPILVNRLAGWNIESERPRLSAELERLLEGSV
ncbi:MAG: aminoglycoside phosphotransferase family protein [Myxococcales bacterium]|nr:aminoglycoside phosphotransferase family protein [Myxococcales bacterium]